MKNTSLFSLWALSLALLLTACGGGSLDPILGSPRASVVQNAPVAPTITAVTPPDGTLNICPANVLVSATFSEPMDAATLNTTTFTVTDTGAPVTGTVVYSAATQTASYIPSSVDGWAFQRPFEATVKAGSGGVKSVAGLPLASDKVWRFTTCSNPS
jgi:Bacterial Ig-like domain